ncbi:MAG: phosphatidylglycerophosphatase A, partial [Pseudomonadota bacterium]
MANMKAAQVAATFFFVGHLKPAPGTWGSLAGALLALPIIVHGGVVALGFAAVVAFAVGLWATRLVAGPANHDPSEIVIDEVAGQFVALLPLAWFYHAAERPEAILYLGLGLGFALFRLFDIWKPWPVSWADRREDAMG